MRETTCPISAKPQNDCAEWPPPVLMWLCCCVYPSRYAPCLWSGCEILASVCCSSPQLLLVTGGCMRYRAPENLALKQYEPYLAWVKRRDPVCKNAQCLCQDFIVKWTGICLTQIVWFGLDSCLCIFLAWFNHFKGLWRSGNISNANDSQLDSKQCQHTTSIPMQPTLALVHFNIEVRSEDSQTRPVVLIRPPGCDFQ